MSSDRVIWLCLKLPVDVFQWMDWYIWMFIQIQWWYVWVSSLVHSLSECITVQRLAQLLAGFALHKFSLLLLLHTLPKILPTYIRTYLHTHTPTCTPTSPASQEYYTGPLHVRLGGVQFPQPASATICDKGRREGGREGWERRDCTLRSLGVI